MTSLSSPNILFLSIEDLNDWIEPLGGHPDTVTPNLTRLAARTMLFEHAYATAPACSPSRTATLYGQYPWETGIYGNFHKPDHLYPRGMRLSLVGLLRDAGFDTIGAGKVFHVFPKQFDHDEWTEWNRRDLDDFPPLSATRKSGELGENSDFGPTDDTEQQYDEINTDWIVQRLQPGAEGKFWALGLYRPHLPFIVPRKYFDMLPDRVADPPGLGMNGFAPDNAAQVAGLPRPARRLIRMNANLGRALHAHGEYKDFVRAYLASIAYADALLGRVLDRMDETGLWDNTVVVLWSDHGWQLGEKLAFRKFTLWERALRVPLFIGGPGIAPGRTAEPVSLIDLAPTVLSLAGVPVPARFSGQDLTPALHGASQHLRGHALSVWGAELDGPDPKLAFSVRTRNHRFIHYWTGAEELYDHRTDPFEHHNLMHQPAMADLAQLAPVRDALHDLLPTRTAAPVRTRPQKNRQMR